MNRSQGTGAEERIDFEGLTIRFDHRVLRPRAWTEEQSRWAATLLARLEPGPVLELCAGAGQIGLAAVTQSRRHLVCVDADPVACGYAAQNARLAGMADRVEVRRAWLSNALAFGERFALVIADPPWVPQRDTDRFPEDPLSAIDGGSDGLDVARECIRLIGAHLTTRGAALLQLGSAEQAAELSAEIERAELSTIEVRRYDGGVVAQLDRPQP